MNDFQKSDKKYKTKTISKKTASCLNQNMISRKRYECKKLATF